MTTRQIRNRSAIALTVAFVLWIILEAAGVGTAFAFYAAFVGLAWLALAFGSVWRKR